MLQLYRNHGGRLDVVAAEHPDLSAVVWVDLISPTPAERSYIIKNFRQPLFSISELEDIESSARFYEDENGIHILSFFLCDLKSDRVRLTTIGFVLKDGRLFTLREKEISTFRVYITRCKRQNMVREDPDAYGQLLNILETKTEQLADEIEFIYGELENLNRSLLARKEEDFDVTLLRLASLEDSSGKVRLCLMDSQRALVYLSQKFRNLQLDPSLLDLIQDMTKNIESLIPHNEALFQRINFMSQTAMGLIEINQNRIMKVISVLSIVSLPATLITSWLGMDIPAFFGEQFVEGRWQVLGLGMMALICAACFYLAKGVRWI